MADPNAPYGGGRFAFVDMFIPDEEEHMPETASLELKNASLRDLWVGQYGPSEPTTREVDVFRAQLQKESVAQLLQRKVSYWRDGVRVTTTVEDMREEAHAQIIRYLNIIKQGASHSNFTGVSDRRVRCRATDGSGSGLLGYIVICVGATRVLAWKVDANPQASCSFELV